MPNPDAFLTWLFLPLHFTMAWLSAGAEMMTGARV